MNPLPPHPSTPKITNVRVLTAGRIFWGLVFFVSVLTYTLSLPALWEQMRVMKPEDMVGLNQLGLSADVGAPTDTVPTLRNKSGLWIET